MRLMEASSFMKKESMLINFLNNDFVCMFETPSGKSYVASLDGVLFFYVSLLVSSIKLCYLSGYNPFGFVNLKGYISFWLKELS